MVRNDLRHTGGFVGRALDARTFDSSQSKQLLLLRSAIIVSMAARLSNATIQNSEDADAVAQYLRAASEEINYVAANVYPVAGRFPCRVAPMMPKAIPADPADVYRRELAQAVKEAGDAARSANSSAMQAAADRKGAEAAFAALQVLPAGGGGAGVVGAPAAVVAPIAAAPARASCAGYYVNFESELPFIEGRIVRLLFATLPQDRIRNFAADVEKGNVMGGAWNAMKLAFVSFKGLHYGFAAYRTGQEAVVHNLPAGTSNAACSESEATMTVVDAARCLGLNPDSLFGPHPQELGPDKLPAEITEETFAAIFQVMRTSCVRLPLGTGATKENLAAIAKTRKEQCEKIEFNPEARPDSVQVPV